MCVDDTVLSSDTLRDLKLDGMYLLIFKMIQTLSLILKAIVITTADT